MILVYYLIMINLTAFVLYGIDKRKAINHSRRISEATLIMVAAIGGALGAFAGMLVFHHKTKKKKFQITVPILLAFYIILNAFFLYQNYHIVITEYDYQSPKVSESMDGYVIVQISDLHNQWFGFDEKILLSKIRKCEPDMIVVTGDVLDSGHTCYEFAEDFFRGAVDIAPVYYITGNHEEWLKGKRFDKFLTDIEKMGVRLLDDKMTCIDSTPTGFSDEIFDESSVSGENEQNDGASGSGENEQNDGASGSGGNEQNDGASGSGENYQNGDVVRGFKLVGISESSLGGNIKSKVDSIKEECTLSGGDEDTLMILLAHEPRYLESYNSAGADLVLVGHNHGGQFVVPGKGGFISPDMEIFPKFYGGRHSFNDTTMIISRGLGNSVIPVRINNYPEIVKITLHAE